ncbi:hypothetical protein D3C80_1719230 [compost metagenome]
MQAVGGFRRQDVRGANVELLALLGRLRAVVEGHADPVQARREKLRGRDACRAGAALQPRGLAPDWRQGRGDHLADQRVVALLEIELVRGTGVVRGTDGVGMQEAQVGQVHEVFMQADVVARVMEIPGGAGPGRVVDPCLMGDLRRVGEGLLAQPDPQ